MRCGQCHISIFRLCSIAQTRFGEVRFSEQETDLERKSLTFIYITQTFSTGNSWGSICLLLVLSYSLRILGTYSNNVISLCLFFPPQNGIEFWSLWDLVCCSDRKKAWAAAAGALTAPYFTRWQLMHKLKTSCSGCEQMLPRHIQHVSRVLFPVTWCFCRIYTFPALPSCNFPPFTCGFCDKTRRFGCTCRSMTFDAFMKQMIDAKRV